MCLPCGRMVIRSLTAAFVALNGTRCREVTWRWWTRNAHLLHDCSSKCCHPATKFVCLFVRSSVLRSFVVQVSQCKVQRETPHKLLLREAQHQNLTSNAQCTETMQSTHREGTPVAQFTANAQAVGARRQSKLCRASSVRSNDPVLFCPPRPLFL